MRHLIRIAVLASALALAGIANTASAQGKAALRIDNQEDQAQWLYEQGEYQQACEILMATAQARHEKHSNRVIHGITLFFLIDIIGILFFLYIEKRKAYKLLVDKNSDCARRPVMNTATIDFANTNIAEGKDQVFLEELQRLFESEKIYLDSDLTIESLASRMGTNRSILSKLINQHLGRTFPTLLNQYRVGEAVRLLTDAKCSNYTIEAIGQMCGYNNRQVFHSAFKKEAGLSPSEFRNVARSQD